MAIPSTRVRVWGALGGILLAAAGCCCRREVCSPCGPCAPAAPLVGAHPTGVSAGAAPTAPVGAGSLTVTSVPDGDVWIDGEPVGTTPYEGPTSAGVHEVIVRLGGFEEHVASVTVAPGAKSEVSARLVVRDVEDRQLLQLLGKGSKLYVQAFEAPAMLRGDDDPPAVAEIYPRGQVRVADLGDVRVDFAGAPGAGEVRFRRGDAVLGALPVDASAAGAWIRPIPENVRSVLAVGDVVTWGFHPQKGEAVETTFEVADKDLDATFASLETGMAGQPKAALSYLKIQVLSDAGLPYGAHQEALRLIKQGQGSARAWASVLDSLDKMGAAKSSLAWREAQARVASLSRAQQTEVFSGGDYLVAKVHDQMRLGQAGRALQSLDPERLSTLAQSASSARSLATDAAAYAGRMAERAPGSARKLADTLLKMARSAREQAPDDPEARWALAHAQVALVRTQRALGDKVKPDAFREAADTLVGSYDVGAEDDGLAFVRAVEWLREGSALAAPAERTKLLDAAKGLVARAKEKYPDAGASAAAAATQLLAQAEADAPKDAKARVLEAAGLLKPLLEHDPVDPSVGTAHTDLVTFDRRRGLKTGVEYRTEAIVTDPDLARFLLPLSSRWVRAADLPAGYLAYVEQRGPAGDVVRAISIRAVKWTSDYQFASGLTSGGENTGLLAKYDLEESRRGLTKVKDPGRVERTKFSKAFPKADAYDVRGIDHDGARRRVRGWMFRSERSRITFMVTFDELRGAEDDDPELAVFRESFEDVVPGK